MTSELYVHSYYKLTKSRNHSIILYVLEDERT